MTIGVALAVVMFAGVVGVLVLAVSVHMVGRVTGRLPTVRQTMAIVVVVAAIVLAVLTAVWPDVPAEPVMVVPTTYGPPPDPLAGYDPSELP